MKRTGFIAIVGRPNVGKSTMMNSLLGEKVAIVSSKPQTTRNRILGILTKGDDQFVFMDTPGIHNPKNRLGSYMVKTAKASMQDADAVVLVADCGYDISKVELNVIDYLKKTGTPSVLVLNKIDLYGAEDVAKALQKYSALYEFDAFVPISAKNGKGVDGVLSECSKFLGESEWIFPDDIATDQPERQIAAEIIREKLLRTLNKEIPHGIAVSIDKFTDTDTMVSIYATIYCEKQSHKGIIVGRGGEELKRVGSYAREELEKVFGTKVFLNLWVKVKENWRDSLRGVTEFGYNDD